MNFISSLAERTLLFDGATGSLLAEQAKTYSNACTALLNIKKPLDVMDVHMGYLMAGADVISANTFCANSIRLSDFDLQAEASEIVTNGVALAKESVVQSGKNAFVAASIGPTGLRGEKTPERTKRTYDAYYDQCMQAASAGADLILIETMDDLYEGRLALLAAKAASNLPVLSSYMLEADGNTFAGNPPGVLALSSASLGASMVGVNCGLSPTELFDAFSRLCSRSNLPVFAMPHASNLEKGEQSEVSSSESAFAEEMIPYLLGGAQAVGGCCGTTHKHIEALRNVCSSYTGFSRTRTPHDAYIASAYKRLPLKEYHENSPSPIHFDEMTDERIVDIVKENAQQSKVLEFDFGLMPSNRAGDIIRIIQDEVRYTPFVFAFTSSSQAKAVLKSYVGVAGVKALSDMYSVMKTASKYGAHVLH